MEAQVSTASVSAGKWSPSREASDLVKSIHAMLHPRNIVLVGATDKPGNYAERIWNNLIKYQYQGGLYPVNAKRETIWGVPCYKDFASLPDKPDHVLVLVPARFAVQVVRDAAAAGATVVLQNPRPRRHDGSRTRRDCRSIRRDRHGDPPGPGGSRRRRRLHGHHRKRGRPRNPGPDGLFRGRPLAPRDRGLSP